MSVASFPTLTINVSAGCQHHGCQHHGSRRCHLLFSLPHPSNKNLTSIHKLSLWDLWDIAPYAKGSRRSLTPWTLGNRHTDLGPDGGPCSGLWTDSSPSLPQTRKPLKDIDKRAFVEVCVSRGEVSSPHCWRKKEVWTHWSVDKRNSLTLPTSLLPQNNTA